MKSALRFPLLPSVVSLIAAAAFASVAMAQPPPPGGTGSPTPGPGSPGSGYPKPIGRIVLPSPDARPPRHRFERSSDDAAVSSVASVQRALKKRGYYSGPVDGDAGSGTKAAIRGFRREHGLGTSSQIDAALLRALRL